MIFDPLEDFSCINPELEYLPEWKEDISTCKDFAQLPDNAKSYVRRLEELLNHEIQFVSVGAECSQYL